MLKNVLFASLSMVDYFQAFILAIVQGITEWLPVSSSAHLAIIQHLFNISPPVFFDIALHLGTLVSVLLFFRNDIIRLINEKDVKMLLFIIIASIPTAIIGLALRDFFESFFSNITLIGIALLVTGAMLFSTRYADDKKQKQLGLASALMIGVAQGIAVAPGISRSGSTISIGMLLGIEKEKAARFSFLLSIPAVLGASILEGRKAALSSIDFGPMVLGVIIAAAVGYLTIGFLLEIIRKNSFSVFAYYCWLLGVMVIILGLIG